jgi:hypothetical protein
LGKSCREDRKMLKIDNQQISFTDYLIPEELTVLDDELSIIDEYLNDDRIVQPFIEHFHKKHGRPSTPLQVYLRMMYIKRMYSFSYENIAAASFRQYQMEKVLPHTPGCQGSGWFDSLQTNQTLW